MPIIHLTGENLAMSKKTTYKGKYKEHDVSVTIHTKKGMTVIESIERDALRQTPMTEEQMAIFNELKSYEFFVPFRDISCPQTGNGSVPNRWEIRAGYGQFDSHFRDVGDQAPFWIKDVASGHNKESKTEKFNFYFKKWVELKLQTLDTHAMYNLCKLIHDEVTAKGTKPIAGYHAPTPLEVLERILPEKYNASKKAS
jgi:hypothetical protein